MNTYNGMPATELSGASWRKSSISNSQGACVELAKARRERVRHAELQEPRWPGAHLHPGRDRRPHRRRQAGRIRRPAGRGSILTGLDGLDGPPGNYSQLTIHGYVPGERPVLAAHQVLPRRSCVAFARRGGIAGRRVHPMRRPPHSRGPYRCVRASAAGRAGARPGRPSGRARVALRPLALPSNLCWLLGMVYLT